MTQAHLEKEKSEFSQQVHQSYGVVVLSLDALPQETCEL